MSDLFSLSFDPRSLKEIAAFAGFSTLLSDEVQGAFEEGGKILVSSVRGAMHWQHPSGALEASIGVVSESHYEIDIGSPLIYARRRDWGFVGRYDSLGRGPYSDQGAYYLETGLSNVQQQALRLIDDAVVTATQRLGA